MIKSIILAVLIALMSDPLLISATQTTPKFIATGTILAYPYSIELSTKPGYVGGIKGMAKAVIKPTEGFKWNKNYPAKFEIQAPEFAVATPVKNKLEREDFKMIGNGAILCISFKGEKEGRIQIEGKISFSMCNKKECFVFRNQKLKVVFIALKK